MKFSKLFSLFVTSVLVFGVTSCGSSHDNQSDEGKGTFEENTSQASQIINISSDFSTDSDDHSHDFSLSVEAIPSETEPGIINAVITLDHIHTPLIGIEFQISYSSNTVEGVYTETEDMGKFMTVVPTYTTTLGVDAPRFEQICKYERASSLYKCIFVDLLSYPSAASGQTLPPVSNPGEIVITIPFKVNHDATAGKTVTFTLMEDTVKGTSAELKGIVGDGASVTYVLKDSDIVS